MSELLIPVTHIRKDTLPYPRLDVYASDGSSVRVLNLVEARALLAMRPGGWIMQTDDAYSPAFVLEDYRKERANQASLLGR